MSSEPQQVSAALASGVNPGGAGTAEGMAGALDAGWLELWYQPKIGSRTLDLQGGEALIRMCHPQLGIVQPARFIPRMGARLLPALSQFVIARALADWRYFLAEQRPLDLSINLPISFFDDPKSFDYLCRQLPDDPAFEGLILEVDGSEITRDLSAARDFARQARLPRSPFRLIASAASGPRSCNCGIFRSSKSKSSPNWWLGARTIARSERSAAMSSIPPINSAPARWRSVSRTTPISAQRAHLVSTWSRASCLQSLWGCKHSCALSGPIPQPWCSHSVATGGQRPPRGIGSCGGSIKPEDPSAKAQWQAAARAAILAPWQ